MKVFVLRLSSTESMISFNSTIYVLLDSIARHYFCLSIDTLICTYCTCLLGAFTGRAAAPRIR